MSGGNAEEGVPNLTPILDMVFQLITFFMLVINFKSAELDMSLKLPVVGSAKPVLVENQEMLVLNIDKEGGLNSYGTHYANNEVGGYIKNEAAKSLVMAKFKYPNVKEDELPTIVVVRADRNVPFKFFNRVITACQTNGYRDFALKAMNKEEEPEK